MARKKTPGLIKRGQTWHIQKKIFGRRLCESTGTNDLEEAEKFLAKRIEEVRQAVVYGVRPERMFREAATKFLMESDKRSLIDDAQQLKLLDGYIGDMPLDKIHIGSLQRFIDDRRQQGLKTRTINKGLQITRHILKLAANDWRDENGLTWLHIAPKIELLPEKDKSLPYPLSWAEQTALLKELPKHLAQMALFKVNTGCRDHEVCHLQWDWEIPVPELDTSVFLVPSEHVKNAEDRLVVLNNVAKSVIDEVRGENPQYVFTYRGRAIHHMNNSAWRKARTQIGLPHLRVHDLKHTFGRRLRAAGVSYEDRQDLLGHRSTRITTHYSAAELQNLIDAANKVCNIEGQAPTLVLIKRRKTA